MGSRVSSHRPAANEFLSLVVLLGTVLLLWLAWPLAGARWMHHAVAPPVSLPASNASAPVTAASSAATIACQTGQSASDDLAALGQVGDLFGGVNALFAALALAGVIWAGMLQRRALLDARVAYELERRSVVRQQFEATFFHLVTLLREIGQDSQTVPSCRVASSLTLQNMPVDFRQVADVLFSAVRTAKSSISHEQLIQELVEHYDAEVQATCASALGRYFRALHQTLALIDIQPADCLDEKDKVRYANIVRGQIPDSLVLLLAANGLRSSATKTRKLIIRYGLLKYLADVHEEKLGPALREIYGQEAFEGHAARQKRRLSSVA